MRRAATVQSGGANAGLHHADSSRKYIPEGQRGLALASRGGADPKPTVGRVESVTAAAAAPGDGTGLGWPRGRASRPRRSRPMPPHGRRGRVTGRTYVPAAAGYHGVWYSFGVSTGMGCTGGAARAPREPEGDSPGHRGGRLPHAVPTPSRKSRGACVLRVCFRVETDANTRTPTSTARPFRPRGAHVWGWLERRHEPAKHGRLLPAIASIV